MIVMGYKEMNQLSESINQTVVPENKSDSFRVVPLGPANQYDFISESCSLKARTMDNGKNWNILDSEGHFIESVRGVSTQELSERLLNKAMNESASGARKITFKNPKLPSPKLLDWLWGEANMGLEPKDPQNPMPWDAYITKINSKYFTLEGGVGPGGYGSCIAQYPTKDIEKHFDFVIYIDNDDEEAEDNIAELAKYGWIVK